jgi:hypothetical protein
MSYMNDYDLQQALRRFSQSDTPNRLTLTLTVAQLRDWTNRNSDGWAYWDKPRRAAARAIDLIESKANPEHSRMEYEDITAAELKAALRPIKMFLTRQKVNDSEREAILS